MCYFVWPLNVDPHPHPHPCPHHNPKSHCIKKAPAVHPHSPFSSLPPSPSQQSFQSASASFLLYLFSLLRKRVYAAFSLVVSHSLSLLLLVCFSTDTSYERDPRQHTALFKLESTHFCIIVYIKTPWTSQPVPPSLYTRPSFECYRQSFPLIYKYAPGHQRHIHLALSLSPWKGIAILGHLRCC